MVDAIENYIKARFEAGELRAKACELEDAALELAKMAPIPLALRQAAPEDIVFGAVIWYPHGDDDGNPFWKMVEQVLQPSNQYSAYLAEDGCSYGLDGAFVELVEASDNFTRR